MDDMKMKESAGLKTPALGRRDLMKMGVSAGVASHGNSGGFRKQRRRKQPLQGRRGEGHRQADELSWDRRQVVCSQRQVETLRHGPISLRTKSWWRLRYPVTRCTPAPAG